MCGDRHDQFFQCGIAGPFPNSIDGAMDLVGALQDGGQGVGHRQAQVIVAMDAENRLIEGGYFLAQLLEKMTHLQGCGIAHGIGQIDRCRSCCHNSAHQLNHLLRIGTESIYQREFHIVGVAPCHFDGGNSQFPSLLDVLLEEMLPVVTRSRDEGVDSRAGSIFQHLPGDLKILGVGGAGQCRDNRSLDFAGDTPHGLVLFFGGCRKAGFQNIHIESGQLFGNSNLFRKGQDSTR